MSEPALQLLSYAALLVGVAIAFFVAFLTFRNSSKHLPPRSLWLIATSTVLVGISSLLFMYLEARPVISLECSFESQFVPTRLICINQSAQASIQWQVSLNGDPVTAENNYRIEVPITRPGEYHVTGVATDGFLFVQRSAVAEQVYSFEEQPAPELVVRTFEFNETARPGVRSVYERTFSVEPGERIVDVKLQVRRRTSGADARIVLQNEQDVVVAITIRGESRLPFGLSGRPAFIGGEVIATVEKPRALR